MRVPSFEMASCWDDGQALGVEERGELLEPLGGPAAGGADRQGGRGQEVGGAAGNSRRSRPGRPRGRLASPNSGRPGSGSRCHRPSRCVRTSIRLRTLSSSLSRM